MYSSDLRFRCNRCRVISHVAPWGPLGENDVIHKTGSIWRIATMPTGVLTEPKATGTKKNENPGHNPVRARQPSDQAYRVRGS